MEGPPLQALLYWYNIYPPLAIMLGVGFSVHVQAHLFFEKASR